ncbi:MAG: hypothetical protein ACSNEK_08920 [Parachlamydiaceae bacterium]
MLPTCCAIVTYEDIPAIKNYVKTHAYPIYQPRYKEFVPWIATKIEAICKKIFALSQTQPTRFIAETTLNLDKEGANLIIACMKRTYGFDFSGVEGKPSLDKSNAFDHEILRDAAPLKLTCWWTPKNPYLFPNQTRRRYQPNPAGCSQSLLIYARTAVETDLTLVSVQEEEIHAHALLFKLKSKYFKTALEGQFKKIKR